MSPGTEHGLHLPGVLWVHPARGPPGGGGRPERGQPEAGEEPATRLSKPGLGPGDKGHEDSAQVEPARLRGHLDADG